MTTSRNRTQLHWTFPLPRTHTGILMGNGVQGLMIWGTDTLNITVGRAGFWDHRGGSDLLSRVTYSELRKLLESGDEKGIKAIYARGDKAENEPDRPVQLGCGRFELRFGGGAVPREATLDMERGIVSIEVGDSSGRTETLTVHQSMHEETAWIEFADDPPVGFELTIVPAWDFIGEQLSKWGYDAPRIVTGERGGSVCQGTPADGALALVWRLEGRRILFSTFLGSDADGALKGAAKSVEEADPVSLRRKSDSWWKDYRHDIPRVELPDPVLQEAWEYGTYKQAGMSTPGGVAATLQGPWLEEYQLPPWSSDYHFNINIQMIYWPCLGTNRLDHLGPLWDMIVSWMPKLKHNAECFFEAADALMLPHAVDDRCSVQGSFWTGTIDHACTAWMAQLAWMHYRYGMDELVLREVAWPLLVGAFNGYWAMLEEVDGGRLSLPVSVSPEYGGSGMDAWGRDASFQLAALHFVAATLPEAARLLGERTDPRWEEVRRRVPPYTTVKGNGGRAKDREYERIALWEGQDLEESHRHHSHLGSIYPFQTIDPEDPQHAEIVAGSMYQWIRKGMGAWTGWCIPWASIICSRLGFSDAAVSLLHWWNDVYTNMGRGTLHNAGFDGITLFDTGYFAGAFGGGRRERPEVMQMDAGMGAVTAVIELLVQNRSGTIAVLPSIPARWNDFSFDGIRTEGAFLVGATVRRYELREVRVTSLAGGPLRLSHRGNTVWEIDGERFDRPVLERETRRGEELVIRIIGSAS